ncbi:MAG: iron-containing alcohol dehydrogenase [Thermodesulfobacteriota bacterium]
MAKTPEGQTQALRKNIPSSPKNSTATYAFFYTENCWGGGSPMDTAKGTGVVVSNGGKIADYVKEKRIVQPNPYLLCIPTTYGTGSEVTNTTVLTDETTKFKHTLLCDTLTPSAVILDPNLSKSLPFAVARATGLDTLTHAVEAFVSVLASPFTDALAFQAMTIVAGQLKRAVENDVEAVGRMLTASTLAGMSFCNAGLGVCHALAHALGGYYDLGHGLVNGMLLPYVVQFNLNSRPDRFQQVALALGGGVNGGSRRYGAAAQSISLIQNLLKELRFPANLKELGVRSQDIPHLAQTALLTGIHKTNPQKCVAPELEGVLHKALNGDLDLGES